MLVDDSYNANPGSLAAAIDALAAAPEEGWLVLGDMRELGPDAEALHAQAGIRARAAGLKRLYALGPLSAAAAAAFGEGGRHSLPMVRCHRRCRMSCTLVCAAWSRVPVAVPWT